jgi:ATP-dependent 26S proteasome regulatory subunit
MLALRQRRMDATQEDFEMTFTKVMKKDDHKNKLKII